MQKPKPTCREYAASCGLDTDKISVVGFIFKDESAAMIFHFRLMSSGMGYFLFDRVCNKVVILISKNDEENCIEFGKSMEGEYYKATFML